MARAGAFRSHLSAAGRYKSHPHQALRCLVRGDPLREAGKAFSIAHSAIWNGKSPVSGHGVTRNFRSVPVRHPGALNRYVYSENEGMTR